jgi:hypothetical protein
MSFVNSFEKIAMLPLGSHQDDFYSESAKKYYQVTHSPILAGAVSAAKYGLPTAAISALVSPKGLRGRNAAILGGLVGAISGATTAADQKYKNSLEKAHIHYHLDN